jgi:hypothetical protein
VAAGWATRWATGWADAGKQGPTGAGCGWLYVTPALTAIVNLRDRSHTLTPEVSYTGIDTVELRARWVVLHGAPDSEFGARPIRSRLEAFARWSF